MDFEKLENKISYSFKNKALLKEALTHRSYLNENPKWGTGHNERLEFLGDAVLELAVTESLFKKFPKKEEGELTVYRSALVNSKSLALVGTNIGLGENIKMSRGEEKSLGSRGRDSVIANAVEALLGAIYIDKGYEPAKDFINKFILSALDEVVADGGKDAKSLVQEAAQSELKITPTYKVIKEEGPAHQPVFRVGLYFDGALMAKGVGASKQDAETKAAEEWLKGR